MRRRDREITEKSVLETIIMNSVVCRLALMDGNRPYMVPLNFGYKDNTLYFHSAPVGKKIEIIKLNPNVCFEFDIHTTPVEAEEACAWSMNYQSVIGFGKAYIIEDDLEKRSALSIIMQHYSGKDFHVPETELLRVAAFKVEIESMTGKQSGQL